jgi:RNA polymerase sigma-70 factor (ECF subfamily)
MNGPIDARQLGELLDQHGGALALYAAGWTKDPDDCVQEALVELARQRIVPNNAVAWLYRVVRNRALNAGRGERRRRAREARAVRFRPAVSTRETADRLDGHAACDALERLPALDRQLVVLRVWGGLKWDDIARVTGQPRSTVHRRYQQALLELRNQMESSCKTQKTSQKTGCPTT